MSTQFAVDLVFKSQGTNKLRGITSDLDRVNKSAKKTQGTFAGAANGIRNTGRAAKGAAVGVKGLGVAFKAALGPIGAALAAIGGLSAAFNTLKQQDFAEAKFKTLGGNADELVDRLKEVSKELKGQQSVVELTAASYDVASAGFTSAADASQVLKAASLGATGGFADLNTVANATMMVGSAGFGDILVLCGAI